MPNENLRDGRMNGWQLGTVYGLLSRVSCQSSVAHTSAQTVRFFEQYQDGNECKNTR